MERAYFNINEEAARQAKQMMSFSEYREGSKTEEYRRMCDKTYDLAEKVINARPDEEKRICKLAESYAKKLADNMNKDSEIGCRCPSVMISGAGNFPVKRKEKQVAAWEKNHKEFNEIQRIRDKIQSIEYGKDIIKSSDEDAVEKLEKKLAELTELQERMKAANRAIRMKDKVTGNKKLCEMGFSEKQIEELRKPDFCGRVGFPDYALKNNNATIRNTKGRIAALKREKERGTTAKECKFFKVEENTEDMRIRLRFNGIPEKEVREVLKSHGFRWAPSVGCWQRHLNNNGRYAVESVIIELEAIKG